jgi:hypothetical protein
MHGLGRLLIHKVNEKIRLLPFCAGMHSFEASLVAEELLQVLQFCLQGQ